MWPLAAVVCRSEISASLVATGLEHFNTNAMTNAAGAVGEAVLRVMREERLLQRADEVGRHWMEGLRRIQRRFPALVADVRGVGLFIGVELRKKKTTAVASNGAGEAEEERDEEDEEDEEDDEPATAEATWLVNRLRSMENALSDGRRVSGVLLSTDGPYGNVLKMKPPMVFSAEEAELVNRCLERGLAELTQQQRSSSAH